jgi:hypothetical protein
MRAQALAILTARHFQRQCQQNLLTQNVFEQKAFALIIADLGFGVGHRQLVPACVCAQWPIQQLKVSLHILRDRLKTTGTGQFEACCELTSQPYVLDYLVLTVMLLDELSAARRLKRGPRPDLASQVDDIGLKLLLEFDGMEFQFFDVEEHEDPPRDYRSAPARGSTPRDVSTARSKT